MAEKTAGLVNIEVSVFERQWLRKAVETQRGALIRSRAKELDGSEIWSLRGREIEALTALLSRLG